jgi:hypothetical protein
MTTHTAPGFAASGFSSQGLLREPLPRTASRRRRRGALIAMLAVAIGGGLAGYLSRHHTADEAQFGPFSYASTL